MNKYSAQKLKSVSLNNDKRRYSSQHGNNGSNSDNAESIIKPVSETEPNNSGISNTNINPSALSGYDWTTMFHKTFLSVYMDENHKDDGLSNFDYVFNIGNQTLYVLVHQESVKVDSPNVPKKLLSKLRQQAGLSINKRFHQLRNSNKLQNGAQFQKGQNDDNTADDNIHYIGITSITIKHNDNEFQIEHKYESEFFQEECVSDLDEKNKVLQLFSLNNFYLIINLLQTPSDLLCYFDYHLDSLMSENNFEGELELAEGFLDSDYFYHRAVLVQQKLVEIGLLHKVETRLANIFDHDDVDDAALAAHKAKLSKKMQSHSTTFQKLLNGATKRRHKEDDTIPKEQIKLLVRESMYTRLCIIEEMMAYETRPKQDCIEGYLAHQHSYNDFGHHYVIIVYGLDENAEYTQEYVKQNYQNILMDINAQLQNPAMKEYFLLGFDMSNVNENGNVKVQMDIYHQSGSSMSDIEKHLYIQSYQ